MEVTPIEPQTVQKALGETVNLGCTYIAAPEDTGELDIEWSNLSPDMTQKDQLVGRRGTWLWFLQGFLLICADICLTSQPLRLTAR